MIGIAQVWKDFSRIIRTLNFPSGVSGKESPKRLLIVVSKRPQCPTEAHCQEKSVGLGSCAGGDVVLGCDAYSSESQRWIAILGVFRSENRSNQCLLILLADCVLQWLEGAWEPHGTAEISRRRASRLATERLLKGFREGHESPASRPLSGPRKLPNIKKRLV